MAFNQYQGRAMNALDRLTDYKVKWRSVQYQGEDYKLQPLYPPYTKVNVAGDVVKVYPDGKVYIIKEEQWREFATLLELPQE